MRKKIPLRTAATSYRVVVIIIFDVVVYLGDNKKLLLHNDIQHI